MEELDRAIGLDRRAVAVAEPDDPDLLVMQSNLAAALLLRSDYRSEDLDEAIAITARALADAPPEHPRLAPCLANAATALRWRFMRSRERCRPAKPAAQWSCSSTGGPCFSLRRWTPAPT